jgi:hypothetical protein
MVQTVPHDEKGIELCRISVQFSSIPSPPPTTHNPKNVLQKES